MSVNSLKSIRNSLWTNPDRNMVIKQVKILWGMSYKVEWDKRFVLGCIKITLISPKIALITECDFEIENIYLGKLWWTMYCKQCI